MHTSKCIYTRMQWEYFNEKEQEFTEFLCEISQLIMSLTKDLCPSCNSHGNSIVTILPIRMSANHLKSHALRY